jgi:hypothetical protein
LRPLHTLGLQIPVLYGLDLALLQLELLIALMGLKESLPLNKGKMKTNLKVLRMSEELLGLQRWQF